MNEEQEQIFWTGADEQLDFELGPDDLDLNDVKDPYNV